jgi:hypothetical protein
MAKCNLHSWEGSPQVDYCYLCEQEQYKINVMNNSTINVKSAISQSLMEELVYGSLDKNLMAALVEVATQLPKDSITCAVMEDLKHRADRGLQKYNTTLGENDHQNMLQHAYEEALDMAQYLKKEIITLNTIQDLVKKHPNDTELGMLIRNKYGKA